MIIGVLFPFAAVFAALGLIYKLGHLRRNPRDPALIALCLVFAATMVGFTVSVPAVAKLVAAGIGLTGGTFVVGTCLVLLLVTSEQILLTYWTTEGRDAKRKVWTHLVTGGSVVLGLILTFVIGKHATGGRPPVFLDPPFFDIYLLGYVIAYTIAEVRIARLCRRHAKNAERRWLRFGLFTVAFGAALTLGNSVTRAGDVLAVHTGLDMSVADQIGGLCGGIGAILKLTGWLIPGIAPSAGWLASYRDHLRLRPLWLALSEAYPHIALDGPKPLVVDLLSVRDMKFKTYRRVIEIRDGLLALRPYMDGDDLDAGAEAARIKAALASRQEPGHSDEPPDRVGGSDIASDRRWLVQVAKAFDSKVPELEVQR
ncbi:MAB_1171c family putative transporter [Amycolatopsis sp. NPDC059657]|uniref:MAB_1171c family putative transporter n=1 Tax=Amycolatopsis sp. NPDC059657 TaxID=3346899 RepID=UPI00366CF76A